MDFSLTEDQKQICDLMEELSLRYLNVGVYTDDKHASFRRDKWAKIAETGLLGLPFPEACGGADQGMLTTALAIRTLAQKCQDEGLVFSVCAQMSALQVPLWQYGTVEQHNKFLAPLIDGRYIGSSVISEPGAGSDSAALSTLIRKTADGYELHGIKTFATLAPEADCLLVYGKHPGGIPALDVSAFILEKEGQEFEIGQIFEKMGLRTSPMSEVILNCTSVPPERLVGRERQGMSVFFKAMLWERIMVAAYHVGAMEQQYEEVYKYACERKQFGQRLLDFEGVYGKLVNMRLRLETSRLMLFKTCDDFDRGFQEMHRASMLKLHTSESKVQNSLEAVQIFGAYGYVKESAVEKQIRDSLAAKIYSGTSEMQKKIMLEGLGELYG
ncbi:acyl-CoA dehydrogenase family protein [Paenibacillus lutimineralis]|uniref:Acyl-CoA dehydrogenase n=1 Tax=Paenibacillus lutimineralis TaxID=2707005 RepID=A0A3Q9I9G7_9BACL|nr:acyl-CoA dehydrogenase family protein [Paenibacillus lutimineralis]AZS14177.1 acyl-CoA dehydrogenase [Paenibacillus lutimineralis]